ncbi:MAG: CDP-diacylglycerol--glycerol-3-phosphate 3-phosphatidyltransferase [Alphaproteobacteria bacterium RIFCSPHIGHO2_12_FULL_63_12]|nr:MAG: CDP-diacylglycerol--glycerol-3-phosphate 3-phosphatidyltransferase [Alphaproteobacteria bacterium RIFCSPHIGHO2_12_FULL_63_12]
MANMLTIARIALIVPFAAMFFISAPWALTVAFALFAIAAATDFLDGRIARARGETSALGAALDPLADKLLVAAALLLLVRNGVIRDLAVIAALAILLREILVGGLREHLGKIGASLPVTGPAKLKTSVQLLAIGLLIASAPGGLAGEAIAPAAMGLFWIAAILTVGTGADYSRRAVRLLRNPPG